MTSNHAVFTNEYLLSTQSILHAGRRLRNVLDADRGTVEYAITGLEQAAQHHETGGRGYRAFMFSELEAAPATEKGARERITQDALASMLTDLQAANVLMAGGQVLGETGEKADPRLLDEALLRFENTTRTIERSLASPLDQGAQPGRFGFAAEMAIAEAVESDDLASAISTFQQRSNDTLETLVHEARGVVTSVITALDKLDPEKVLSALSNLGVQMGELPKIGRLVRQGIQKLEGVIDALIRWLDSETLALVKDRVKEVWQDLKEGKFIADTLGWAFAIEATRADIEDALSAQGLQLEALDQASRDLDSLATRFKESMEMCQNLAAAVGFAGTLLALTPLAGPELALVSASAYVLVLAAVVLIGMDYTDTGGLLQRVNGVREIGRSVRPG